MSELLNGKEDNDIEMIKKLSDEELNEVIGGAVKCDINLNSEKYKKWCEYFNSGNGYVYYKGKKLRVKRYRGRSYRDGAGYFISFEIYVNGPYSQEVSASQCLFMKM